MSTTKALVRGQKQMLGVVRGMMGSMNLAALAMDNMQRSMVIAERKAAERMQSSLGAMERAVTAMVTPLDEAAKGITALAEAIEAAGKRMISVTQPTVTAGISTAIQLPSVAFMETPTQAAEEEPAKSERDKLEEKIKTDVIPKFGKLIEMIGSNIPDIKSTTDEETKKTVEKTKQEAESASIKQLEAVIGSQTGIFEEISTKLTGIGALNTTMFTKLSTWLDTMQRIVQTGLNKATDTLSSILDKSSVVASAIAKYSSGFGAGNGVIEALPAAGGSSNRLPAVSRKKSGNSLALANKTTRDLETTNAMQAANIIEHSPSKTLALPGQASASANPEAEAAAAGPAKPKQDPLPGVAESVATLKNNMTSLMTENAAVVSFMADNWSVFGSVYEGVNKAVNLYNTLQMLSQSYMAVSAIAMRILTVATTGLKTAWNGMNTAMKANVIFLIISLVAGLITAIMELWKNNDAFAFFFVKAWYSILEFFAKIPVYFWTLIEALLQPFVLFANKLGEMFDKIVNGIIDKINGALEAFNKLAGTNFRIDFEFSTQDLVDKTLDFVKQKKDAAQAYADEKAAEFEKAKQDFEQKRKDQAAKENEVTKDAENTLNANGTGDSPFQQNAAVSVGGGRLDEVGKINDTVDISSEDLKTMRELAEMKNIQNFVTLQPSVNVQTGDIKNGMDVSSMVQAITTVLQEEISVSAEGVYR